MPQASPAPGPDWVLPWRRGLAGGFAGLASEALVEARRAGLGAGASTAPSGFVEDLAADDFDEVVVVAAAAEEAAGAGDGVATVGVGGVTELSGIRERAARDA